MATTANSNITPQSVNVPMMNKILSTAMSGTKNYDGTDALGTGLAVVFTAHATNPSQVPKTKMKYGSTNGAAASGATANTVLRFFLNNGSDNTVATNNAFIGEVAIPTVTMSQTAAVASIPDIDWGKMSIPAGYRILAGLTTAMGGTNCALCVSMPGGADY